jgi:hypothetical protein
MNKTLAALVIGFGIGALSQHTKPEPRIYHTSQGWALAHVPMPECRGRRIVDAPEKDEVDALSVYCTDGTQESYNELETLAGNQ